MSKYTWKDNFIDLGQSTVGVKLTAKFEYEGDTSEIVSLRPSCDCTDLKFDKKSGILLVSYTTEKVPKHLSRIGYFTPHKFVKVKFDNGQEIKLTFKVKVTNG